MVMDLGYLRFQQITACISELKRSYEVFRNLKLTKMNMFFRFLKCLALFMDSTKNSTRWAEGQGRAQPMCRERKTHWDRRLLAHTVGCPCTTYVGGDKCYKPLPVRVRGAGPVHGIGVNAYPPFRVESDP